MPGESGERPGSTVYERERERDAARLLVEAVQVELDRALERRLGHIERRRARMLEDARSDVDTAQERLLEAMGGLPALRQALVDARETLLWVGAFPDQPAGYGFPEAAALGLRELIERTLNTRARVGYASLVAALHEDASALAGQPHFLALAAEHSAPRKKRHRSPRIVIW